MVLKKILLILKDDGLIIKWIDEAHKLNCEEINSFVTGIKNDLISVKNAIKYEYNNVLAEGSVNKVKVKRIIYGRSSFETLRKKMLLLENFRHGN